MKIVPIFRVKDMKKAIAFYTGVLDFELKYPGTPDTDWVVDLINVDIELQLTTIEGKYGSLANVWVNEVDDLFKKYLSRGHDISGRENSPVHQGPTDQSWGNREFYITDENGNTLRFCTPGT